MTSTIIQQQQARSIRVALDFHVPKLQPLVKHGGINPCIALGEITRFQVLFVLHTARVLRSANVNNWKLVRPIHIGTQHGCNPLLASHLGRSSDSLGLFGLGQIRTCRYHPVKEPGLIFVVDVPWLKLLHQMPDRGHSRLSCHLINISCLAVEAP